MLWRRDPLTRSSRSTLRGTFLEIRDLGHQHRPLAFPQPPDLTWALGAGCGCVPPTCPLLEATFDAKPESRVAGRRASDADRLAPARVEWSVHNVASRVIKTLFKMQSPAPSPVILRSGLGPGNWSFELADQATCSRLGSCRSEHLMSVGWRGQV